MAQEGGDADDSSHQAGHYNAAEFKHLNVSDEIKTLFQQITRFKPQTIELDTKLKPFIPDYIPSIGGIDEFIKVLDEPAAKQSDPTVLTLQLRQMSKEAPGSKAEMIGRIEHTDEQKQKKIGGWVQSINDIHRNKPAATVNYSRRMPDIEALMQEWPPEMEAFVRTMKMPTGDLDLDLRTFTKLVCSILDIPVYDNPVESLHLLFSLYLDFKQNPVFAQLLQDGGASGPGAQGPAAGDALGSWGGHTHSAGSTGGGSAVPWEARGPDTPGSVASGYGKPGSMPAPW
ncbi:IFT complex B protein [Haematococcus lacustris]|uniref:IFT complex B protein n=1 Tax=Haematococcus lacustris TaxID=44745 RepID=A0A699Z6U3_HAELA|nr:IFT complex B protein [Haematococcus lacustris]